MYEFQIPMRWLESSITQTWSDRSTHYMRQHNNLERVPFEEGLVTVQRLDIPEKELFMAFRIKTKEVALLLTASGRTVSADRRCLFLTLFRNARKLKIQSIQEAEECGDAERFCILIFPDGNMEILFRNQEDLRDKKAQMAASGRAKLAVNIFVRLMLTAERTSTEVQTGRQDGSRKERKAEIKQSASEKGKNRESDSVAHVVYLSGQVTVIIRPDPNTTGRESARPYVRHTEAWDVRGHWRHYKKSGKTVWIAPFKKGKGKSADRMYKIKT